MGAPAGSEGSVKLEFPIAVNDKLRLFLCDTNGGMIYSYYFRGFLDSTNTDYLMSGNAGGAAGPLLGRTIEFPMVAKLFYRVFPAGGNSDKARVVVYYSYYLREGRLECIILK